MHYELERSRYRQTATIRCGYRAADTAHAEDALLGLAEVQGDARGVPHVSTRDVVVVSLVVGQWVAVVFVRPASS